MSGAARENRDGTDAWRGLVAERPADPALFEAIWQELLALHRDAVMARRRGIHSQLARDLRLFSYRTAANLHDLERFRVPLPPDLLRHYRVPPTEFERARTPHKYRIRPYNLTRDLLRYARLAPELLDPSQRSQEVLDLSPGACAAHELLTPIGHSVHLADYGVGPASPYDPIHREIGARPRAFDGRNRPFDLPTAMADTVFAFQCFDAYSSSHEDYPAILTEVRRLARRKCVVVFNGLRPLSDDLGRIAGFKARFAGLEGAVWTHCPETKLLALIWHRAG